MKLITELNDADLIVEKSSDGKDKTYFIEGIFMQDTIVNRNGRSYPKKVMAEAVQKYIKEYVDTRRAMGELNHPNSPQVNPERASHLVTSIHEDGNNWIGKAKILTTPMGKLVSNLIDDGVQIGVSTRGLGSLKESGNAKVVQGDFALKAVDIVYDPSAPEAFVNGIMEGKEWVFENGILVEREIDQVVRSVNDGARKGKTEDALLKVFNSILQKI